MSETNYNLEFIVLLALICLYYIKQSQKFSDFNFMIYVSIIFAGYAYVKNNKVNVNSNILNDTEQAPFRRS